MSSLRFFFTCLLGALFFLDLLERLRAARRTPDFLEQICEDNVGNYTQTGKYAANLYEVLSIFYLKEATSKRFHSAAVGDGPDRVYSLFMCRGDVSADDCHGFATFAGPDAHPRCPDQRGTVLWYEQCMLRYSPRNILSKLETEPHYYSGSKQNISSDQVRPFLEVIISRMNETKDMASVSPERFATKKATFSVNRRGVSSPEMLYFLAQCTGDLNTSDCNSCLQVPINWLPRCCRGQLGARVHLPSCNIRFELYKFFAGKDADASPGSPISPGPKPKGSGGLSKATIIAVALPVSLVSAVLFFAGYCLYARRQRRKRDNLLKDNAGDNIITIESLQYDFSTIKAATDNFSHDNKLGSGGFGVVYKGILPEGQEIAVKRLSRSSGQGIEEFQNEVVVVAKLQHKNLVRLLGFCLEREEKILIFEYVSNKSLDYFLFDKEKQGMLDWSARYMIIEGIARGILYLHQDSQLTIIHRDLKTSNILLDFDMKPKISDFGMAKICGVHQTQGNTNRIVGTYGYMSPEYAMYGRFSMESDIYSFGVIILELISGKKNRAFYESDHIGDLVNYAWRLWKQGTPFELLDPALEGNYQENEVIRCIHIGLLCVQEESRDRPAMSMIVSMLNNNSMTLPRPQSPAFYRRTKKESRRSYSGSNSTPSTSTFTHSSFPEVSVTELHPR